MRTSQAVVNGLKAAVDKARTEKQWNGGLLMTSHSFTMTSSFGPFLDENDCFNCANRVECAVLTTLAVLAESWPPPNEVVEEILTLLVERVPDVRKQSRRAPEIVIAAVLGWPHPELRKSDPIWPAASKEAERCLRTQMFLAVDSCLEWLKEKVESFPTEDPGYWTDRILNSFIAGHFDLRCQCPFRGIHRVDGFPGIVDLRGNAKKRAETCLRRHHLSVWDPAKSSLWDFAERAAKGFKGKSASRWGSMASGMLYDLLWHSKRRVTIEHVASRECPSCSTQTLDLFCRSCGTNLPRGPQPLRVTTKRRFIVEGGGLQPKKSWTCNGSVPSTGKQRQKRCGNIYPANYCAKSPCGEPHDHCPICRHMHPTGRRRRTRLVYVLDSPPVVMPLDDSLERTLSLVEDPTVQQAVTKAAGQALVDLDQTRWAEALILLLEEDFEHWIGMLQSPGVVNWQELWQALNGMPDLPASPEDLEREFKEKLRPQLIEIFKFTFGLADLDWDSLDKYLPPDNEADGEETDL